MITKFELGEKIFVFGEIVRIVANKTDGLMYCVSVPVENNEHYELYVKEENIRQK